MLFPCGPSLLVYLEYIWDWTFAVNWTCRKHLVSHTWYYVCDTKCLRQVFTAKLPVGSEKLVDMRVICRWVTFFGCAKKQTETWCQFFFHGWHNCQILWGNYHTGVNVKVSNLNDLNCPCWSMTFTLTICWDYYTCHVGTLHWKVPYNCNGVKSVYVAPSFHNLTLYRWVYARKT